MLNRYIRSRQCRGSRRNGGAGGSVYVMQLTMKDLVKYWCQDAGQTHVPDQNKSKSSPRLG